MAYPDRWIEFHDSELLAITFIGNRQILLFRCYLHQPDSAGRPAGWIQAAALILNDGNVRGEPPDYPANIAGGKLSLGGVEVEGIPVPLITNEAVLLRLSLYADWQAELTATGSAAQLVLIGEPHFVEASHR